MDQNRTDLIKLFRYLKGIRKLRNRVVRDINDYKSEGEKVFYLSQFNKNADGIILNNQIDNEEILQVVKNHSEEKLYTTLFSIYQFLQNQGVDYEIVYSNSTIEGEFNETKIRHPLFEEKVELVFDENEFKFSFLSTENFSSFNLDIFEGLSMEEFPELLSLSREVRDKYINVRTLDLAEEELVRLNNILYKYSFKIYEEPMIILRKKGNRVAINDIENIIEKIESGIDIPKPLLGVVDSNIYKNSEKTFKGDILFPLPYNEEQKEIVNKLENSYGVVVQGPPGTGKSHTIVNLICHLLSQGKKILVTSQREKALEVLRDKLPKDIRDLCISILGSDKTSMMDLDHSIRIITDYLAVDKNILKEEIQEFTKELEDNRHIQKELKDKIKEIELRENTPILHNGERISLLDMAKWLSEPREDIVVIQDKLSIDTQCPLTSKEFVEFCYLMNSISEESLIEVEQAKGLKANLPALNELLENLKKYLELKNMEGKLQEKIGLWEIPRHIDIKTIDEDIVFGNTLEQVSFLEENSLGELLKRSLKEDFIKDLAATFLRNGEPLYNEILRMSRELTLKDIVVPEGDIEEIYREFSLVSEEFLSKGKVGFVFGLKNKRSKILSEAIKINGVALSTVEHYEVIKKYLSVGVKTKEFLTMYNSFSSHFNLHTVEKIQVDNIAYITNVLKGLRIIINYRDNHINKIKEQLPLELPKGSDFSSTKTLDNIKEGVTSLKALKALDDLSEKINEYKKYFEGNVLSSSMVNYIEHGDFHGIEEIYDKINTSLYIEEEVNKLKEYKDKLINSCPDLAYSIKDNLKKYSKIDFEKSFQWAKWNEYLNSICEEDEQWYFEKLSFEMKREKEIITKLVSKRTWYYEILNMSEDSKRSLYCWMDAIKKLGKGTGKFASYYRNLAKEEMKKCKNAIPVWVMPFSKVMENLPVTENFFDVIIFDESSQSDIFALQGLFRAKKAIVVGDENQISPRSIGISKEEQIELMNIYLKGIPNYQWFDLETSFYNTALRIFDNKLILREHFRCVPEIINYSNELSYEGEIVPLRYPKDREKFEKSIIKVKVDNGERNEVGGKRYNEEEARSMVETIVNCCKDEKYEGMTMGVISLLGKDQGEYIEELLRSALSEKEIINRKILCGDAYSFQGDERDIMFLSMVVAKNKRFSALTKEDDKKRFNVAVSRAKNQIWLFHSVDLEDLNPTCIRYNLLSYFSEESHKTAIASGGEITSRFTNEIYKEVKSKGYNVKPNVSLGRYNIDLVIEGDNKILGIYCVGEHFKGIEYFEKEKMKQGQLERAGWHFVTLRASHFYRDKENELEKLWTTLEDLGLYGHKIGRHVSLEHKENGEVYNTTIDEFKNGVEKSLSKLSPKQLQVALDIIKNPYYVLEIPSYVNWANKLDISGSSVRNALIKLGFENLEQLKAVIKELQ